MEDRENPNKSDVSGAPELPEQVSQQLQHETPKEPAPSADAKPPAAELPEEPLNDGQTNQAVDDIVKTESDDLLAAQDKAQTKTDSKPPKKRWWKSGLFWKIVMLLIFVAGAILCAVPGTRYWMLNTAGVRSGASVLVLDSTTGQPLKNVTLTIDQRSSKTNAQGRVQVSNVRLGKQVLQLKRVAFAKQKHDVTIGWGSNPLGTYRLKAVGAQYTLHVTDYLSGQPITGAEASNEEASAVSDKDGKVILTLEDTLAEQVTVRVAAPGYRAEQVVVSLEATEPTNVALIPSTKAAFVSKESGRYDVYIMDIDGKNKKLLLAGTGLENGNIGLVSSPDGAQVALVSTRDDIRAADGMLLTTLTLIDIATGNTIATDRGESLQIMDWIGNRVVYSMTVSGQAEDSVNRQRIVSYDYKTNSRAQLVVANQIRSAASAQGKVYFTDGTSYYRIDATGEHKQSLLDKPVWATYRTDYDSLSLQTEDGWYRLTLSNGSVSEIAEPVSYASRFYLNNQNGQQSLWIEKSSLHVYTVTGAKDSVLHTQSGLVHPLRWLTNTDIVYRVSNNQEVADYVISIQGGEARKLSDVTATFGLVQSY